MNFKKDYLVFTVVILLMIVLICFFLNGEKIDFSATINADKFAAFGTMVASILTAVTVILLYRQNLHLSEEKRAAAQPDLFPAADIFITYSERFEESDYIVPMFHLTLRGGKLALDETVLPYTSIHFNLHNIGLAAAKDIYLNWEFDESEVEKWLPTNYDPDLGFLDIETHHDFIPANGRIQVKLPQCYSRCLGLETNFEQDAGLMKDRPALLVHLKYQDIYNNAVKKSFEVETFCLSSIVSIKFRQLKA